jgi:single-strand DNA-binding protein
MSDFQKIILVGNATRDAEARTAKDGDTEYTSFRMGVKDARGQSSYFPVVVFGRSRESVAQYVKKGRQVLVEGRIDVSESGRASIVANRVVFLGVPPVEKEDAASE